LLSGNKPAGIIDSRLAFTQSDAKVAGIASSMLAKTICSVHAGREQ
jgi:hypothetical protein